ncbi:MAG: hypothetical protein RLZZ78_1989 [Armatimonadota bacterium]
METLLQFHRLADIPNDRGVAAPFAGVLNTSLVVAGGANFPNAYPWEGGAKIWHDRIYRLREPDARWETIGKLPQPLGYGASFTVDGGVVIAGGSDARRHYANCYLMMEKRGKVVFETLSGLPIPLANVGFAKFGDLLVVVGGQETPTAAAANKRVFAMECNAFGKGWFELPPMPGPARILPGVGMVADSIFVCSGADLYPGPDGKAVRRYLRDCYRYTVFGGWKRLADLPKASVAPPCPLPQISAPGIRCGHHKSDIEAEPGPWQCTICACNDNRRCVARKLGGPERRNPPGSTYTSRLDDYILRSVTISCWSAIHR